MYIYIYTSICIHMYIVCICIHTHTHKHISEYLAIARVEEWGPYPYDVCTPLPVTCNGTLVQRYMSGCPCQWSQDLGSTNKFKEGTFLLAAGIVTVVSLIPYIMMTRRFPVRRQRAIPESPESEKEAMKVSYVVVS